MKPLLNGYLVNHADFPYRICCIGPCLTHLDLTALELPSIPTTQRGCVAIVGEESKVMHGMEILPQAPAAFFASRQCDRSKFAYVEPANSTLEVREMDRFACSQPAPTIHNGRQSHLMNQRGRMKGGGP